MLTYLKAISVKHDEPGGVDALQLNADFPREGKVVHVDSKPQVIVSRPHCTWKSWVSPWLGGLLIPSLPDSLPSAPVQLPWPPRTSGTHLPWGSIAILSTTVFKAEAERHGYCRYDNEGEDGEGKAEHQSLVHRYVALSGSRPNHHRLGPLVWEATAVPHGAWAAVV